MPVHAAILGIRYEEEQLRTFEASFNTNHSNGKLAGANTRFRRVLNLIPHTLL